MELFKKIWPFWFVGVLINAIGMGLGTPIWARVVASILAAYLLADIAIWMEFRMQKKERQEEEEKCRQK